MRCSATLNESEIRVHVERSQKRYTSKRVKYAKNKHKFIVILLNVTVTATSFDFDRIGMHRVHTVVDIFAAVIAVNVGRFLENTMRMQGVIIKP